MSRSCPAGALAIVERSLARAGWGGITVSGEAEDRIPPGAAATRDVSWSVIVRRMAAVGCPVTAGGLASPPRASDVAGFHRRLAGAGSAAATLVASDARPVVDNRAAVTS